MGCVILNYSSSWSSSLNMFFLMIPMYLVGIVGAEFTLPGICPNVKLQEDFDHERFSGIWIHIGGYASDGRKIYDCGTIDLEKVEERYTMRETYVDFDEGKKALKWSLLRVDPVYDDYNDTQFVVYHNVSGETHQAKHPFMILSTDYHNYAIAYICIWLKEKERKHYVFTWILTRSMDKLQGDTLKKVEKALSNYTELAEHRKEFVFKEFNPSICAFEKRVESDFFSSYFHC